MSKAFLEQWISMGEPVQVALLSAPVTFPPVPSAALSIFRRALEEEGISSRVIYASFPAIHLLTTDMIYQISRYMDFQRNAEYLFARLTDVSCAVPVSQMIESTAGRLPREEKEKLTELLLRSLNVAEVIVDAVARKIIHMKARVVAASSVYSQQNATLAILKRVKELDPSVYTMMGGYNVSGEMGLTILRHFPSVDYISFGEGDETIARFCADLISGSADSLPYGTLGRNDMIPETAPYRMTKDMNTVATPDYRDFFEEIHLEESGFYGEKPVYYAQTYENTVFLEGSRGCWWGVKHPCSFCGLNGLTNVYREKTPEKLHSEIREMTARYPGSNIQLTDNVLSLKMIREICPPLTEDPEPYSISAEIKSNLRPDDIKLLAQAGVKITQPGIESLNDHLLKLMGKGCNTVQNIALMKYCKTYGVFPVWNLLIQVPDENREDYEEMISLIPQICHLNPPTAAFTIAYNRFSRYTDHPGDYGLELKPEPVYQCCFPDEPDIVNHMFVYFQLTGGSFVETIRQNRDLYRRINDAVGTWRKQYYSETPPSLVMTEFIFGISILDTRPCALEVKRMLIGLSAKIYRLAWEPVSLQSLLKNLPGYEEKEIRETLDLLVSQKLMIFMSGKYLALAVAR